LPITSPEEWHSVAFGVEAVELDLVAASVVLVMIGLLWAA
jgi:hypothetical protein